MIPTTTHGAFSWAELITSDPEAAADFYGKVLPWKSQKMEMATGAYHVQMIGDNPAAGIMSPPVPEIPTYWGFYITVSSVDATLEAAVELGAEVKFGPMDVPGVGRMGGIADPQGAHVSFITYEASPENTAEIDFISGFTTPGRFSWYGLQTSDPEAAKSFYGQLLGWTYQVEQMEMGPYITCQVEGVGQGGITPLMHEGAFVAWTAYITVDDCDATAAAAKAAGGTIPAEPFDIPTVGRNAVIMDPTGGGINVVKYVPMERPA
jgi:uncharacterized protein